MSWASGLRSTHSVRHDGGPLFHSLTRRIGLPMGGTHGVIPGRRARCSAEEVEAREQLLAQLLDNYHDRSRNCTIGIKRTLHADLRHSLVSSSRWNNGLLRIHGPYIIHPHPSECYQSSYRPVYHHPCLPLRYMFAAVDGVCSGLLRCSTHSNLLSVQLC